MLNVCLKKSASPTLPWDTLNFARVGKSTLVLFTELNLLARRDADPIAYDEFYADFPDRKRSLRDDLFLHRPHLVYFSDSHIRDDDGLWGPFAETFSYEQKVRFFSEGLTEFITLCMSSDVRHLVLFTHSPFHPKRRAYTHFILDVYQMGISSFQSNMSSDSPNTSDRFRKDSLTVWVFHWHRLLCPDFDRDESACPIGQYGFGTLLPDGLHLSGKSGESHANLFIERSHSWPSVY